MEPNSVLFCRLCSWTNQWVIGQLDRKGSDEQTSSSSAEQEHVNFQLNTWRIMSLKTPLKSGDKRQVSVVVPPTLAVCSLHSELIHSDGQIHEKKKIFLKPNASLKQRKQRHNYKIWPILPWSSVVFICIWDSSVTDVLKLVIHCVCACCFCLLYMCVCICEYLYVCVCQCVYVFTCVFCVCECVRARMNAPAVVCFE